MRIAGPTPGARMRRRTKQQARKPRVWQNLAKPAMLGFCISRARPAIRANVCGACRRSVRGKTSSVSPVKPKLRTQPKLRYCRPKLATALHLIIRGESGTWPAGNSVIPTCSFVPRNAQGHDSSGERRSHNAEQLGEWLLRQSSAGFALERGRLPHWMPTFLSLALPTREAGWERKKVANHFFASGLRMLAPKKEARTRRGV